MKRCLCRILLTCAIAISALAQIPSAAPPRFEDYKAPEIFTQTPAAPIIETPLQRMYRTRIREGISKGWGVFRDGKEHSGPNFAGHYIVVQWGCGSGCAMMVIVDASTGKIYYLPGRFGREGAQNIVLPMHGLSPAEVEFRLTSRLLTINACPNQPYREHARCYSYYYLWQNNTWRMLRRVRLEDDQF
jgi:hypothetical protein